MEGRTKKENDRVTVKSKWDNIHYTHWQVTQKEREGYVPRMELTCHVITTLFFVTAALVIFNTPIGSKWTQRDEPIRSAGCLSS